MIEYWFAAAVTAAVLAGISNFTFKIAASRKYNSELFTLYGSIASVAVTYLSAVVLVGGLRSFDFFTGVMLFSGFVASFGGIGKVYALRYIDSTIYFPLFKLLSPALAIMGGILLFGERFSLYEWVGIVMGLTVPLMLITRKEDMRQNNLKLGLMLVVFTAMTSAFVAVINKYGVDSGVDFATGIFYAAVGVFLGGVCAIAYKYKMKDVVSSIVEDSSKGLVLFAFARSTIISASLGFALYAYQLGGSLGIVQTIHSMYILIPIVLSIVFYNEHVNTQKVVAIILSIASLAFLG